MWIATLIRRWLAGKLAAAPDAGLARARAVRGGAAPPVRALRWRAPWLPRQLASWMLSTLLAPPFWSIGILLLINPDSDQPFLWVIAMGIVPLANGIAMIAANQRHHRAPFLARRAAAAYLFAIGASAACGFCALLLWGSHSAAELVGLLALAPDGTREASATLHELLLVGGFGIASALPASLLHAWLAFDE
ncbi:hypothetical protein [Burkholderia gladioli]|uniref:hypothetical protein n=1 Tax=Burkholderia gladioli TaxID=28095 RepID=UPI00163EF5E2|nr:hypothetical protein [Burkholderia gladioli]